MWFSDVLNARRVSPAFLSLVIGSCLVLPSSAMAQATAEAQVSGTVTDPSGAAISNAEVSMTQTATNLVR